MMDKSIILSSLYDIYEETKKGKDYNKVLEMLEDVKINKLVDFYIYHFNNYDKDDISLIETIVRILQNIYNNADVLSPITDEEYDKLYEVMINNSSDIVGGNVVRNKTISFHKYPDLRGTLDKVHFLTNEEKGKDNRKSMEYWVDSIGDILNKSNDMVYIFPKFDGVSVVFECDEKGHVIKALTRGDTVSNEAIDITPMFSMMTFAPIDGWKGEFGVKTEVVVSLNNFKRLCKDFEPYKSPRSAISSIINSQELDLRLLKYISVIPLRAQNYETKEVIIHPDAFNVFPNHMMHLTDYKKFRPAFDNIREYMKEVMEIPIDGVVLHLTDENLKSQLGRKDAINKYEVAYKFPPEEKKTILLDVEFYTGLLGRIAPVAKIEPVKINGNTISNVSLGSMDRFESLMLRRYSEVIVKYDIIPYIYVDDTCKESKEELIKSPTTCSYCGETLIKDPQLSCVNPYCPCRIIGKITNYVEKMDIPGISIGIITTLFDNKILNSIEDLYKLENHKSDIVQIDGFGKSSVKNIIKGIDSRRNVFDYNLLGEGYIYSDIRNVLYSLGDDAKSAFINEYGNYENELEVKLDNIISVIITLYFASLKETFPSWGKEYLEVLKNKLEDYIMTLEF